MKKLFASLLACAVLFTSISFPAEAAPAGVVISTNAPGPGMMVQGESDYVFDVNTPEEALNKAISIGDVPKEANGTPKPYNYVRAVPVSATCYHYWGWDPICSDRIAGTFWGDGWCMAKNGATITLKAQYSYDGLAHSYTLGTAPHGAYTVELGKADAVCGYNSHLKHVYCRQIDNLNLYNKSYPMFNCQYSMSSTAGEFSGCGHIHNGRTGDTFGKRSPFNNAFVDLGMANLGTWGLHGPGLCYCDGGIHANLAEPMFGDHSPSVAENYTHNFNGYILIYYYSPGYQIQYLANYPIASWNANKSGTMAPEYHQPSDSFNLTSNKYAVSNATFKGWNTKADGSGTSYTNQQRVSHLGNVGDQIKLYAQWEIVFPTGAETIIPNSTLYSEWRPINYHVIFRDKDGNKTWKYPTDPCKYDQSYDPVTQEKTGFFKIGYYVRYWLDKDRNRYTSYDKDWPTGSNNIKSKFKNLTYIDEDTVYLDAAWEPIKYTLRVHENFPGKANNSYKDYTLTYDKPWYFPQSPFSNSGGLMIGYDWDAETQVNPEFSVGDSVINLTSIREDVIDVYCIWDLPPQVKCPSEMHLDRKKVAALKGASNTDTLTKSDLELWLMSFATATDYEWSDRYQQANVPSGSNKGYTFGVASIEPGPMIDDAIAGNIYTYYVVFECKDDYGQIGTANMTLFVGDTDVDILVR